MKDIFKIFNILQIISSLLLIICILFGGIAYSEEIIFRPGPGLNNGTDDGSLNAGKDAYGGTCDNPDYNDGSSATLTATPLTTCNSCNTNLFIQFNLDSLPADVSHVYLGFTHLPHTNYCLSNCNADFYFYPISQPWNEITITLNNAPPRDSAAYGPINITFPNDFGNREYEITDLYKQWKNGIIPNYGIEISSTTVGCNNAAVQFYVYSSDAGDSSNRPYLRCEKDLSSDFDMDDYSETQGDCNDNDTSIYPGAAEVCGDGKDNNCNGSTDEGCALNITPPSSLTAQSTSSTQIALGWQDNSADETGFKIERKTGNCSSTSQWQQIAIKPANATAHTVSGLSQNTAYAFRVRAYQFSTHSTYSNCASAKTVIAIKPAPATNLRAISVSPTKVNLTWKDNSPNESGFRIYRKSGGNKWVFLAKTAGNIQSFSDATAAKNSTTTTYQYFIAAYNASGNSTSSNIGTILYQPANLTATQGTTANSIQLTWIDKSANETGFEIYRKSGNCASTSPWAKVAALGTNKTTWTDTKCAAGSTYAYKIRAYKKSGPTLPAFGYSLFSVCASKAGGASDGNTPAKTISGPGGSTLKTPVGGLNGGATITITQAADTSGLADDGETLVSKALAIATSSDEALFGIGTFSVSIPVDKTKIYDAGKLELKVRLTTGASYPLFGVYDAKTGTFKVELSGVKNGWKIGVVEDPDIQIIRASNPAIPSGIGAAWLTAPNWKTFEWAVVNHTNMSEADIKANILPVMWETSETLSKAGFRSPKIYIDPRLSPPARVVHLLGGIGPNDEGSHFAAGYIEYANGTWTYTEDQATFSTTLLDDEQLSALGQIYVNYDQFLNLNAQYGVSFGNIVIHELFHAVQYGYDVRKLHKSNDAYIEGTATTLGQTYQDAGSSVTGPSIFVRDLRPNEHARLYQAADDPTHPLQYTKQDFFAYVSKRYGANSLAWTDQLFEYMNTWTANKFGLTAAQYRELYRKATDEAFNALFKKGLSKIYREYALDRAYEHGPDSVLRPTEETEQNGFGQNHMAKPLFQWSNTDKKGLKEFDLETTYSIVFPKIEPLSCYAFYMRLPSQAGSEASAGFPLVFKLQGGGVLPATDSGMKIVAFLEDAYEDMVANGKIEITDVSKPVLIPLKEDAVYLTVLIMNCYVENKNVKVTISTGPYIESATPNPAEKGDEVTLQGMSFFAVQGASKLYFGDKEMTPISWSDTKITFIVPDDAVSAKVKIVVNGITSNELQLDVGENATPERVSGTFGKSLPVVIVNDQTMVSMIGSGTWTLTGSGLHQDLVNEYGVNLSAEKGGLPGQLTVTVEARMTSNTYESWSGQRRYVKSFHEPKFLGADSEYSHSNDGTAMVSYGGGADSIIADYTFLKEGYGSFQVHLGFELRYDINIYDINGNLVETQTDLLWNNFWFYTVYVYTP